MAPFLLIFWTYSNKEPKFKGAQRSQIQKIVNIEGFKGFHCTKYAYTSSINGFTHEQIVILSSHMHRPYI